MSCTYKTHNPATDGPADLYNRMNQIDCAMKKFGGSKRKRTLRKRPKRSSRYRKYFNTKSKTNTRNRIKP